MIVSAMPYVGRHLDFTIAAAAASSSVKPASVKVGIFVVVVLLRNFRCCFLNLPRRRLPYVLLISSRLLRIGEMFVVLMLPVAEASADAFVIPRRIYTTHTDYFSENMYSHIFTQHIY